MLGTTSIDTSQSTQTSKGILQVDADFLNQGVSGRLGYRF